MSARQQKEKQQRTAWKFLLGFAVLILAVSFVIGMVKGWQDHQVPKTMEDMIRYVHRHGGDLVECRKQVCHNVSTGDAMGSAPDGYYFSYPEGTVSQEELEKQTRWIKAILAQKQI